ncbi:protein kinase [Streptomyces sp. NPDC057445]|uniref:serine/threonine-protein kinase n=1 Tax=Streptomyces sp. NPDC057445 TaxID=3346136 RepID=UPI0036A01A67
MTGAEGDTSRVIAGRYRLLRRLGAGGMGRVWLAHDDVLDCDVTLKELDVPPDLPRAQVSARVERARGEARHAAKLRNHPNVVTVHDIVEQAGLPWIVMEYVPGAMDLEAFVQAHGPLAPAEVAAVGLGVLEALAEGHQFGILHRDVKPANILLAPGGRAPHASLPRNFTRVTLADYGISLATASQEPRLTGASGIAGTPGYLAPERVRGGQPTPESDLFSLGATLYFAAVGKGPYDMETQAAALTAPLVEEPKLPEHISAGLAQVVDGLLDRNPAERTTGEEAKRILTRVAAADSRTRTEESAGVWGALRPGGGGTSGPQPDGPGSGGPGSDGRSQPLTVADWQNRETVPVSSGNSGPPPRRKLPGRLVVALASSAVVLLGAGLWAGAVLLDGSGDESPPPSPTGPLLPYGAAVGLAKELKPGDCVAARWQGKKFVGEPRLKVVHCTKGAPTGQVVETHLPASVEDAERGGNTVCGALLKSTVDGMADARSYAVPPSEEGWDRGVRAMPCLVSNNTAPIGGPVGRFRAIGDEFLVGNASIGDCFNSKEVPDGYSLLLADCGVPHQEQIVGFVQAPSNMTFKEINAGFEAANMCANDFGAAYTNDVRTVQGWLDESHWDVGFHYVMCTLNMKDGSKLPGGTVQPAQARQNAAPDS